MKNENKDDITLKIISMIDKIRPYLIGDGGDIEFIKYEDNYVFVKFYGSCINCMYKDYTIQDNLYETIKSEIPEVKGVISVDL